MKGEKGPHIRGDVSERCANAKARSVHPEINALEDQGKGRERWTRTGNCRGRKKYMIKCVYHWDKAEPRSSEVVDHMLRKRGARTPLSWRNELEGGGFISYQLQALRKGMAGHS